MAVNAASRSFSKCFASDKPDAPLLIAPMPSPMASMNPPITLPNAWPIAFITPAAELINRVILPFRFRKPMNARNPTKIVVSTTNAAPIDAAPAINPTFSIPASANIPTIAAITPVNAAMPIAACLNLSGSMFPSVFMTRTSTHTVAATLSKPTICTVPVGSPEATCIKAYSIVMMIVTPNRPLTNDPNSSLDSDFTAMEITNIPAAIASKPLSLTDTLSVCAGCASII